MPDPEGRMSSAEVDFIRTWILRKHKGTMPTCPISLDQIWMVVPQVQQALVYPVSTVTWLPQTAYPYVQVICITCGYAMRFNAAIMGLFPPPVPPTKTEESDAKE